MALLVLQFTLNFVSHLGMISASLLVCCTFSCPRETLVQGSDILPATLSQVFETLTPVFDKRPELIPVMVRLKPTSSVSLIKCSSQGALY